MKGNYRKIVISAFTTQSRNEATGLFGDEVIVVSFLSS